MRRVLIIAAIVPLMATAQASGSDTASNAHLRRIHSAPAEHLSVPTGKQIAKFYLWRQWVRFRPPFCLRHTAEPPYRCFRP